MIRTRLSLAAALAALLSTAVQAADLLVPSQYPTIQAAITAAANGDRVVVSAGTYNEHLTWTGKSVNLKGAAKETTIIDGTNTGQCLLFDAAPAAVRIEGFTFRNGKASTSGDYKFRQGAAISAGAPGQLVTVAYCTFTSNTSNLGGGAINARGATSLTVTSCTFTNNITTTASSGGPGVGGGAICASGNLTVTGSAFTGNRTAAMRGGAIDVKTIPGKTLTVKQCLFVENTALMPMQSTDPTIQDWSGGMGGAIACSGGSLNIANTRFNGNKCQNGGGAIYAERLGGGSAALTSCSFAGNTARTSDLTYGNGGATYFSIHGAPASGGAVSYPVTVTNCTFIKNTAVKGVALAFDDQLAPKMANCIVWLNSKDKNSIQMVHPTGAVPTTSVITYTAYDDPENPVDSYSGKYFNAYPKFVRLPFTNGPADYGDLRLLRESSLINRGNDAAILATGLSTDVLNTPRRNSVSVDVGAYEYQIPPVAFIDPTLTLISNLTLTNGILPLTAGNPSTLGIELELPAPAGGGVVTLTSSNAAATVPASVTVPAGARRATFPITTTFVPVNTPASITATYKSAPYTVSVVVTPLKSLTVSALSVAAGERVTGTVTMTGPMPTATVITLSSVDRFVTVPATVTVPAGASSVTFPVTMDRPNARYAVILDASFGGMTRRSTL